MVENIKVDELDIERENYLEIIYNTLDTHQLDHLEFILICL